VWNLECLQKHFSQKRGLYFLNMAHFEGEREKIFILFNVQTKALCFYKVRFSMFTVKKVFVITGEDSIMYVSSTNVLDQTKK
jgi:hypothetical protein